MNHTNPPIDCSTMEEHLEDLALDTADEPLRSALLDHAAGCVACRRSLDDLSRVVDEVLAAAPELEPPVGFEQAVLAGRDAAGPTSGGPRNLRHRTVAALAAAAAAVVFIVSLAVGSALTGDGDPIAREGVLVDATEQPIGTAQVSSDPQPHALVALDYAGPRAGTPRETGSMRCQVQLPGGTWVAAGSWTHQELEATGGVWAAALPTEATVAVAMRILDESGTVVARAELT